MAPKVVDYVSARVHQPPEPNPAIVAQAKVGDRRQQNAQTDLEISQAAAQIGRACTAYENGGKIATRGFSQQADQKHGDSSYDERCNDFGRRDRRTGLKWHELSF
jgi:hypothetical protein